jgi:hypothetical protein
MDGLKSDKGGACVTMTQGQEPSPVRLIVHDAVFAIIWPRAKLRPGPEEQDDYLLDPVAEKQFEYLRTAWHDDVARKVLQLVSPYSVST